MSMLKPYSTLAIGIAIGYFAVGKIVKMLPIGGSGA